MDIADLELGRGREKPAHKAPAAGTGNNIITPDKMQLDLSSVHSSLRDIHLDMLRGFQELQDDWEQKFDVVRREVEGVRAESERLRRENEEMRRMR